MKAAIFAWSRPDLGHNAPEQWAADIRPHSASYFTTEMLQRTSRGSTAQDSSWSSDHFALERMARDLRRDNIARLIYGGQIWIADVGDRLGPAARQGFAAIGRWLAPLGRWIERAVDRFDARAARWQSERREDFLAESTDVYDLERRIRSLERRSRRPL
jgi:hypothetical protein